MNQYIRVFMPLVSETKGYEYKGKTPSGRCLLESRAGAGKLMLWAQDLKPETIYRAHLIFKDDNTYAGLPLCTLPVLPNGKGELRHSFNAMDIEGYGRSLDQCLAVAVIAGEGRTPSVPLCGYREGQLPWRSHFKILEKKEKLPERTVRAIPREAPKEVPVEKVVELLNETPKTTETPNISIKIETPEKVEAAPDKAQPVFPLPNPINSLSDAFKDEVEAILKSHTHMQPFQKQNRDVQWVRISLDEGLSLPDDVRSVLKDPFVENAYNQYNHLLLGKTTDDGTQRYYIGVPALYDPGDRVIGFRQFKGSMDTTPVAGDYGYWLIFMS